MTAILNGLDAALSALALAGTVGGVAFLARRRAVFDAVWARTWFVGLLSAMAATFVAATPWEGSAGYLPLSLALCCALFATVASPGWGWREALAFTAVLLVAAWPATLLPPERQRDLVEAARVGATSNTASAWPVSRAQDEIEAALVGATPLARADFDIYLMDEGRKIIYVKEPCGHGGRAPLANNVPWGWGPIYFIHAHPKGARFREERIHFDYFGADFATRDAARCVTAASLPYPIRDLEWIQTGQFDTGGIIWAVTIDLIENSSGVSADLGDALSAGLVYGNNATPYAVHIVGDGAGTSSFTIENVVRDETADALDAQGPISSWLERDANDGDHLVWVHHASMSRFPDYDTADIRGLAALREVATSRNSTIFRVDKTLSGGLPATWRSVALRVPAARSFFDLYVDGTTLIYVREACSRADTEKRFFLHIVPVSLHDLPEHRIEHGFEGLDFDFIDLGARFDGKCLASRSLPAYDIALVRTGQFGGDGNWSVEISFDDGRPRKMEAVPSTVPR